MQKQAAYFVWEAAFVEALCEHWKAKRGDTGYEEYQMTKLTLLEESVPLKNFVLL